MQLLWVGWDEWHNTTSKMIVYMSPKDQKQQKQTTITVPYWTASIVCYEDILLLCKLSIKDYPAEIGPFPCPESYVKYMDSLLQYVFSVFEYI